MRRSILAGSALVLLLVGLAIGGSLYWTAPTVLRIAIGPAGSDDAKLIAAAAQYLGREHESIRLKIVPTEGERESARALEADEADLAVVRSDIAMPAKAETVAIMHRDAVVIVAPPDRGIATLSDLRERRVGIVRRGVANARLLELLLAHIDVPTASVTQVMLDEPAEVEQAFRDRRIDAVMAVGTISGRTVTETFAAASAAGGGASPVVLPVSDADAVALRSPLYESADIVRGVFGGAAPRPAETMKTLAVTHRLVAATSLGDNVVAELTRLIFSMRPTVALEVPLANRIAAPDTAKGASLPVHAGASAYYEGEVQSFLERNTDWIYLGAMMLSVVGSGFAAIASRAGSRRRERTMDLLHHLLAIIGRARVASSEVELDTLQREADDILAAALGGAGAGSLDDAGISAFALGLDQARCAILERRTVIDAGRGELRQAAE